jgi:iron complex outermembrane receptor protein
MADAGLRTLLMGNPSFTPLPTVGPGLATGFGECIRFPGDTDASLARECLRSFFASQTANQIFTYSNSYAGYGEASYSFTDRFTVSAGLRYTSERKRVDRFGQIIDVRDFAQLGADPSLQIGGLDGDPTNGGRSVADVLLTTTNGIFTNFDLNDRSGGYTPRLTAQYRVSDAFSTYATFSRGFVGARFNGELFMSRDSFVDPETVTQYEVGFNSRWLGGKLTLNAAAYTNLYRGVQRTVTTNDDLGNVATLTSNVGKAVINGGEVDIAVMPLPRLLLTSSVAVKAGRYQEFNVLPTQPSFKEAGLPGVTPLTMDFAVNYSLPLFSLGDLRTRINWRHDAKTPSIVADPSFSRIPKHGVLGSMLTLDFKDGVTSLALFGTNLLDREYFVNVIDFSGSNGTAQYFFAPPRQYGLELRRKF